MTDAAENDLIAELVARLTGSDAPQKKETVVVSEREMVEFWIPKIKDRDTFIAPSAISPRIARAILKSGQCKPEELRKRGITF